MGDWFGSSTTKPSTPQWVLEATSPTAVNPYRAEVRMRAAGTQNYLKAAAERAKPSYVSDPNDATAWMLTWEGGELTNATAVTIYQHELPDKPHVYGGYLDSNLWSNNGGKGAYSWGTSEGNLAWRVIVAD